MASVPPLVGIAIIASLIGTAISLFWAWQLDPTTFQRRAGLVFKIIFRIIAVPVANMVTIGTLILSAPLMMFGVTVAILRGESPALTVKLS